MATQVAVKNTFLSVGLADVGRPRGETCDTATLLRAAGAEGLCVLRQTTSSSDEEYKKESSSEGETSAAADVSRNTTLMLRNIPNKYTQQMLLEVIDADFQGLYNFFYLPIDFKNKCNVGYAFLNFIEPYYCQLFWRKFSGRRLTGFKSRKVCDISWGRVQGLKNNVEHYRNSSIMSLPCQEYKPLLFRNGVPVPFPPPTNPNTHVGRKHHHNKSTDSSAAATPPSK